MLATTFKFLQSAAGQLWLTRLAQEPVTPQNHLRWAVRLREAVGSERAGALIETALLRRKAQHKFARADQMYFDAAALEMSSAELVSRYRAQRYRGYATVADLGCGIGGDAIGLADVAHVIGVDRRPLRLTMAQANLAVYQSAARFTPLEADLRSLAPVSCNALFFDPARRDRDGRRIFSLHAYRPPLTILDGWRAQTRNWGVKVSPAVDYAELPADAEVEFISVNGELREAVLWYGALRRGVQRSATLLPAEKTLNSSDPQAERLSPPLAYLYEPDSAVIRAHLVTQLAAKLDAAQIDRSIALLTGARPLATAYARCFQIEAWLPFQLKRLRKLLRERDVGHVVIKKRGSPLDVEQLRRQLRLRGSATRTLFMTHVDGQPAAIITQPV